MADAPDKDTKLELRRGRRADDITNRRRDGMFAATLLCLSLIVYVAVYENERLSEYTQGVITMIIGALVGFLTLMFNFEFGTTRGSTRKDAAITDLTKAVAAKPDVQPKDAP